MSRHLLPLGGWTATGGVNICESRETRCRATRSEPVALTVRGRLVLVPAGVGLAKKGQFG